MKFGRTPLDEAAGAIAAHTLRLESGRIIKKGTVLGPEQISALKAAGRVAISAARLDRGDIPEDEAARRIAAATAGTEVRLEDPAAGRCNLFSRVDGLFLVDRERIDRLNLVDEAVTVATLPAFSPVRAGDMVGTVKIMPYAVREDVLRACEAATAPGAVRVAPYQRLSTGLVLTRLLGTEERVLDRIAQAQRKRLERYGSTVDREIRCAHDEAEVETAIRSLLDEGHALVLLLGASAIADRRDVIPAAIERAGGLVEHFGMPVDPGNLLLLGRRDASLILGVPGCARSLRRSGFDMVVERIAAGLPVARADLMTLGVGGLLLHAADESDDESATFGARRDTTT